MEEVDLVVVGTGRSNVRSFLIARQTALRCFEAEWAHRSLLSIQDQAPLPGGASCGVAVVIPANKRCHFFFTTRNSGLRSHRAAWQHFYNVMHNTDVHS